MHRSRLPVVLLLAALILPGLTGRAGEPGAALSYQEGFEQLADGLPPGWSDTSTGEVIAKPAADRRAPKEGEASWRIQVPYWDSGAARFSRAGIPLRRGTIYLVEVWLKGANLEAPVTVALERSASRANPHVSKSFAVGQGWRRCVLEGRSPADDPNAAITLSLAGSGTFWVDGLRIAEGPAPSLPETLGPAPMAGNLVYNASFELGADGWTAPEQVLLVQESCPEGQQFARAAGGRLEARPFPARPQVPHAASAFLRAVRGSARVEMALVELGSSPRASRTFELTGEWKRYSLQAPLPCDASNRYILRLRAVGGQLGFDADAVQVEEGEQTDFRPAASVEVSCAAPLRPLFPRIDQAAQVSALIYAPRRTGAEVSLRYRLEGFYGEGLAAGTAAVPAGVTHAKVPLRVPVPAFGTLRLVVDAMVGRNVVSQGEALMTCLPPPTRVATQAAFFGGAGPAEQAGLAARAGLRWWRVDGTSGGPSEADLNALRANGLAVLCSAPASAAGARSLVARSRGRIAAFELGAGFEAAQALRSGDPRALLVDGGLLASDARAGLRRAPGVAAASYDRSSDPESVAPAQRGGDPLSRELRDLRVRAGGLPLWNTDGGAPCPSFYSWAGGLERSRAAARALAKSLILSRANGVERFFVPVWGPPASARTFDSPPTGARWLLDFDGGGRPTLAALSACAAALDGSQAAGRVEGSGFRACVFRQGADTVVAAWSPAAREAPRDLVLKLDRDRVRATNLMGNPKGVKWGQGAVAVSLRNEPVYIRARDTAPAVVLRALQAAAASPAAPAPARRGPTPPG